MAAEKSSLRNYYVLIPMMTVGRVKELISALVAKGYTIGPLSSDEKVFETRPENLVTIAQFNVVRSIPSSEKIPINFVHDEIKKCMTDLNMKYFMLWVGEPSATICWGLGNVIQESVPPGDGPYRTSAR